jgi:hypothetical protein
MIVQSCYHISSTSTLLVAVPVKARGGEAQDAEVQELEGTWGKIVSKFAMFARVYLHYDLH